MSSPFLPVSVHLMSDCLPSPPSTPLSPPRGPWDGEEERVHVQTCSLFPILFPSLD